MIVSVAYKLHKNFGPFLSLKSGCRLLTQDFQEKKKVAFVKGQVVHVIIKIDLLCSDPQTIEFKDITTKSVKKCDNFLKKGEFANDNYPHPNYILNLLADNIYTKSC